MNTVPARFPRRQSRRSSQRGVAAIFVAISMLLLIPITALVVDIGQLYYAQRDLQKLATIAALDASRAQSGCFSNGSGIPGTEAAALSAANNALVVNNAPAGASGITAAVALGRYEDIAGTRTFTPLASNNPAVDAVRVTLTRPTPRPLLPFFNIVLPATGTLAASSSAQHAPQASFMIGTTTVTVNQVSPLNSLLSALLGGNVNLTLIGYQGLANANVTLAQIQAALGVGNAEDLLDLQLPQSQILDALATALANTGQTAAANTLQTLADLADPNRTTTLGNVLGIEDGAAALVDALPFNALSVLQALALSAAHGLYPLNIPNLGVNVANLVSLDTFIEVGQPQRESQQFETIGLGRPSPLSAPRTVATTQQITLKLRAVVNNVPGLAALAQVKLGVDVAVSSASSQLTSILCPSAVSSPTRPQPVVALSTTVMPASLTVGSFSTSNPSGPLTSGPLLSAVFGLLTVNLNSAPLSAQVGGAGPTINTFNGPFPSAPATVGSNISLGNTLNGLSGSLRNNLTICTTPLICLQGGSLAAAVTGILSPVTNVLDGAVTNLRQTLGVQVGAAQITVLRLNYGNESNGGANPLNQVPSIFNEQVPAAPATR